VVGVGQEPKFEDGVTALPVSLTGARTTPANDGVNIGGALRHVRFSHDSEAAKRSPWLRGPKCNGVQYTYMEIANAHIHVLPKLD
jgi:hypothetical protein